MGRTVSRQQTPSGLAFDFYDSEEASPRKSRRRKRRGGGAWIGLAVLAGVVLLAAGVTVAFLPKIKAIVQEAAADPWDDDEDDVAPRTRPGNKPTARPAGKTSNPGGKTTNPGSKTPPVTAGKPKDKDKTKPVAADPKPEPKPAPEDAEPKPAPVGRGGFPRRALIISVHNYLYANPIVNTESVKPPGPPNIGRLKRALYTGLKIPSSQIFHLSDADPAEPRPPLKPVIEQGLVNFLKTTRKQDRILVFFIGHTREIDNEAYLVPLEGEFEDARTLIPLKWVFDQLKSCPCRQKILVLDGNRVNAAQGEERPNSGPMSAKFEAALKTPPAGVQVWSACGANQQSHEFDGAPLGLFLDSVRQALAPERGFKGALVGRIQKADELIPLDRLQQATVANMRGELERRKLTQKPLTSGSAPLGGEEYNREEAPPQGPAIPLPAGASHEAVKEILSEISLPPLKGGTGAGQDVGFTLLPPFSPDALKAYQGQLKPDSRLRQAVHEARVALWAISTATPPRELQAGVQAVREKLRLDLSIMRDSYSKPGAGAAETAFKNQVFEDSKAMSRIIAQLEDVLEKLKEAGDEKKEAPKRWQANYTFILARFQAQLAYLEDYQSLLGQMRKEFPPHDPAVHNGWKMAAKEKASDSAGKKYDKGARKLYAEAAAAFRGTPWEVLAKREKLTALGLEWQPN
jgi:hypothetical protein